MSTYQRTPPYEGPGEDEEHGGTHHHTQWRTLPLSVSSVKNSTFICVLTEELYLYLCLSPQWRTLPLLVSSVENSTFCMSEVMRTYQRAPPDEGPGEDEEHDSTRHHTQSKEQTVQLLAWPVAGLLRIALCNNNNNNNNKLDLYSTFHTKQCSSKGLTANKLRA